MAKKPTYEELKQRVKELEKEFDKRERIEGSLKEREKLLQALLNAPTETAILVDLEGTILAINEIAAKRVGKNVDDLIGLGLFEYLPHDVAAFRKAKGDEVVRSGKPVRFQDERAGRFYDNNIYPVFDDEKKVTALAIYSRDITEPKRTEEALRESEEIYRNLVERANDGVSIVQNGEVKFSNTRLAEMLGYTVEEIIDTPFLDYVFPDERSIISDIYKRRFQGEDVPDIYEMAALHKNGRKVDIETNSGIITYHGKPATLSFVRDITDRKQAEEALRESEERFRSLIQTAVSVILYLSPDHLIIEFNPEAERFYGKKREDVLGKNYLELFIPEEDRDAIATDIKNVLAGKPSKGIENRLLASDGSERVFVWNVNRILDFKNKPLGIVAVGQDITERKKVEEALRESEIKFRTLADFSPIAISILRGDHFLYVNSAWENLTGYSKEEARSLNPLLVVHPDMRESTRKRADDRVKGKQVPSRYEMKGVTKSGEVKWFDFSATAIEYDGEPAIITVANDITYRKQAQEEREKLINELHEAIKEIKTLRGILPLCSFCKKIRDDKGYWEQVDVYIHKHSQADISHSVCPACAKEHYPDLDIHE